MNTHAFFGFHMRSRNALWGLISAVMLGAAGGAGAAITDLATVPVSSSQTSSVKPNIMLLMDTSDSMSATHMPDDLEVLTAKTQPIGYTSNQCNSLYFNPSETYVLPKIVDSTTAGLPLIDAPAPSFTAAPYNYYETGSTPAVDLSTSFKAYDASTRMGLVADDVGASGTGQAAYYYVYTGTAPLKYNTSPCTDPVGTTSTTGGSWAKVIVSGSQQANFAVWYTYYRTRMLLVKSGIGRAIAGVDDKYRVGLISASPLADNPTNPGLAPVVGAAVVPAKYQPIADFDTTQRSLIFTKLYAQKAAGASPMREGLARVGRHYSDYGAHLYGTSSARSTGINNGMPEDPVEHKCQRNYTIMTTDGYWNKSFETVGPVKMDGTTLVGQQDSPLTPYKDYAPRPIFDGGTTGSQTEQRQLYDYQIKNCSSGMVNQTVTQNNKIIENYFLRTQTQYRMTQTPARETQTTATQTKTAVAQQTELATWNQVVVTQTTEVDTTAPQTTETRTQINTQVTRSDTQQTIQYQYIKKTVSSAVLTTTTLSKTVLQLQAPGADGKLQYVPNCTDAVYTKYGPCGNSANAVTNQAIDPLSTCANATPSALNGWMTVTCTAGSSTASVDPATCVAGSVLTTNPVTRQSCVLTSTISYVANGSCSAVAASSKNGYVSTACSGTLTPALSAGPVSGSAVATTACTATSSTSTNLIVPADATSTTGNSYSILCPKTTTTPTPVDPATCVVTGTTNGSTNSYPDPVTPGLSKTCTLSVTSAAFSFNSTCPASTASPTWTTTTCPISAPTTANVSLTTCPAAGAPVISGKSSSTRTTCLAQTSTAPVFVDPTKCTSGFQNSGAKKGLNVVCTGPTTLSTTNVATCSGVATGFNGTNYTTCGAQTQTNPTCTHLALGNPYTDPVTHITYTCTTTTVPDIAVVPGSCVAGATSTGVVNGITYTYTCNAQVVTKAYVPVGTCQASGKNATTKITCSSETATQLATAKVSYATGDCSAGSTGWTFDAASGVTVTCSGSLNNATGKWNPWVQENVGASCSPGVSVNLGWNDPTWSHLRYASASGVVTTCGIHDVPATSINAVCQPGTDATNPQVVQTCTMTSSALIPSPPCTTQFNVTAVDAQGNPIAWERQNCGVPGTSITSSVTSCTPDLPTANNNYTTTTCTPAMDSWQLQSRYSTSTWTQAISGTTLVGSSTLVSTTAPTGWVDLPGCTPASVTPPPASPIPSVYASDMTPPKDPIGITNSNITITYDSNGVPSQVVTTAGCTSWPCIGVTTGADNGSQNSLADVAQYYYVTDLRADMAPDPSLGASGSASLDLEADRNEQQHMVTYVVGLGVNGTLVFDPTYRNLSNTTGDFADIRTGAKNWPVWPTAAVAASSYVSAYSDPRSIDDFWHAAVDGRGEYFSARDSYTMVSSIMGALNGINASIGAGSGATVSTAAPNSSDSTVFKPSFKEKAWSGDIEVMSFDIATNSVTSTANSWSAQVGLDAMVTTNSDTRNIFLRSVGGSGLNPSDNLIAFSYANLTTTQQTYFDSSKTALLSQYISASATQRTAMPGSNLVAYLRGQRGLEDFVPGFDSKLYRVRDHVLGDIVGSQPAYVKGPNFAYVDTGYASFKTGTAAARKKMLYAGANDGMLHAFYAPVSTDANWADRGKEAWAYIPSQVLPNMYKLADVGYSVNHQFMVDGSPIIGDVFYNGQWSTILVGGLNNGGAGYYALDITNPDAPKSLWEFTLANDVNLGKSYGRPIITKLVDQTWVAIFTSGYNNADGNGYVYVVNAVTGALIRKVATGAGSAASPSGLREINNWVNNAVLDNTTQRVYGGDVLGNVWRVDVNGTLGAVKLATLTTGGLTPAVQPVTTRVELAEIGGDPYVFVGTGKLLGASDFADTTMQSIYSFKDAVYANGDVRSTLKPMGLALTTGSTTTRSLTCTGTAAVCAQKTGWVIDLPEAGERMNLDFRAAKGTLAFVTNVPATVACSDGHSWLNYVDEVSGNQVAGASKASDILDTNALAVGLTIVEVNGANGPTLKAIGVSARAQVAVKDIPWGSPPPAGKRISWREVEQ